MDGSDPAATVPPAARRPPSVLTEPSAVGRVTASLERIASADGVASAAVLGVFPARALARAAELDALPAADRGPLHGVPFLAKGNMAVAGEENVGMGPYAGWRAAEDADAIRTLEALGAVLVGRTAFPELSLSGSEVDSGPAYRRVPNPWDPQRTIGGSSSGSAAAVALGLVPLSLGTDTGGSVRIPAAFAGIPAIKPTHDLLPGDGVLTVSWTLDQAGLLAEDVELLRTAVAAVAAVTPGGASGDASGGASGRRRVGVVRDATAGFHRTHPDVAGMLDDAAARLADAGWDVVEVTGTEFLSCQPAVSRVISIEAARTHGPARAVGGAPFGPTVTRRFTEGAALPSAAYVAALAELGALRDRLDTVLADVDVLLSATVPFPAPLVAELPATDRAEHAAMTRLANATGVPAVTVPGAWTAEGMPLGCQLMARHGEDLLAVAAGAVVASSARAQPPVGR